LEDRFNYASFDCAARILSTNPGAKSAHAILSPHARDSYLRNLCGFPAKFVVIELCQDVRVDTVVLGNYEYFSSTFREVEVAVSKSYPPKGGEAGWRLLGRWEAANRREDQVFRVQAAPNAVFARYLRVRFLSHYGSEYYCPVSVVKVYGKTMIDDFEESKSKDAEEAKDSFVLVSEEEEPTSRVRTATASGPDVCPMITFSAVAAVATPAAASSVTTVTLLDSHRMNGTLPPVSSEVGLQVFKPTRPPLCPLDFFDDDLLALAPHFVPDFGVRTRRRKGPQKGRRRRKKKTMIYPLVCLNQRALEPQMCSSRVRSVVVFEEDKKSDDKGEDASGAKENIFKAIHDRMSRLEADSQYLRDATGASLKRIESQVRRLRVEVDIGRDDEGEAEEGYAYRERLKRSLFKHLRERMGEVDAQLAGDLRVLRAFEGTLLYLAILTLVNLCFMLVGLYALYRRRHAKQTAVSTSAEAKAQESMQEVPLNPHSASASSLVIGASKPMGSISLGEASMLAASPLLLFDPETDLVDRIYPGSPTQDEAASPLPEAAALSSSTEIGVPEDDNEAILQ
jgi:hypothetical protein